MLSSAANAVSGVRAMAKRNNPAAAATAVEAMSATGDTR